MGNACCVNGQQQTSVSTKNIPLKKPKKKKRKPKSLTPDKENLTPTNKLRNTKNDIMFETRTSHKKLNQIKITQDLLHSKKKVESIEVCSTLSLGGR